MKDLGELERMWRQTGDENDRFRWLCARLRSGWEAELADSIAALKAEVRGVFSRDEDVEAACAVAFDSVEAEPRARLGRLTQSIGGSGSWYPAPLGSEDALLKTVLDPRGMVGLYPHRSFDTVRISRLFLALFAEGLFFSNFRDSQSPMVRSRGISRLFGAKPTWEWHVNLAVGATLGPLVGLISINARDSL